MISDDEAKSPLEKLQEIEDLCVELDNDLNCIKHEIDAVSDGLRHAMKMCSDCGMSLKNNMILSSFANKPKPMTSDDHLHNDKADDTDVKKDEDVENDDDSISVKCDDTGYSVSKFNDWLKWLNDFNDNLKQCTAESFRVIARDNLLQAQKSKKLLQVGEELIKDYSGGKVAGMNDDDVAMTVYDIISEII